MEDRIFTLSRLLGVGLVAFVAWAVFVMLQAVVSLVETGVR